MKKILFLGLVHGVNDCIAGFVLGSLLFESIELTEVGISILIYNVLAFGGQVPFASLLKEYHQPKRWLIAGLVLIMAGLLSFGINYKLAVLCLGLASAIVHVVGGYETVRETDKALGLGIFASPGVMGLILGGYLAHIQFALFIPGLGICFLLLVLTYGQSFSTIPHQSPSQTKIQFDRHDAWMILILTVIAFRSVIWNVFQLINEGNYETLFIIGISAMLGKIAGGYMSDIGGHRKYTFIALMIAMPLLTLLKNHVWALFVGIFFLQSTVPSSAKILLGYFQSAPAKGISFVFGLSIILGGIFSYLPIQPFIQNNQTILFLFLTSIGLLFWENKTAKFSLRK